MDLGLTESQLIIRNSAREFLRGSVTGEYVRAMAADERGCTDEMWRMMAEMGWLGMIVPERFGGAGMGFVDLAVLLEEMGAAALPGPFFSTALLGALAIATAGTEEQQNALLPRLASGDLVTALALHETVEARSPQSINTTARQTEQGWLINGRKMFVADAGAADVILVVARVDQAAGVPPAESVSLFAISRHDSDGMSVAPLRSAGADHFAEVRLENVSAPPSSLIGEPGGGWPLLQTIQAYGAAGKCAEMVGGARRVVDMTVEYAKDRVQFGRPIGAFQAVQHALADMATDVEAARQLAYRAAWRLEAGLPAEHEIALAKTWLSDRYPRICAAAHQCHGAIGFTEEHDLQLYTRHALSARVAFGDARAHRDAILARLGL